MQTRYQDLHLPKPLRSWRSLPKPIRQESDELSGNVTPNFHIRGGHAAVGQQDRVPNGYVTLKEALQSDPKYTAQTSLSAYPISISATSVTGSHASDRETEIPCCGGGDGHRGMHRRPPHGSTYWSEGPPMNSKMSQPPGINELLSQTPRTNPQEQRMKELKPGDEPCSDCVMF
eukprot:gnl/MRDRNA2_/MRDRNA2_216822_c0_seq1.p1 gnl/MRDRNA2_/MRDRNA2_216822_c0~~gnl/MRDRNA2_/MRDRNA2_216822_c0_seq1.p1  ORF type:complete len:174 (-),score=18.60 gnl/MRDRNA2_/MRDRNA2_216822_c0_seq1:3-524(-)